MGVASSVGRQSLAESSYATTNTGTRDSPRAANNPRAKRTRSSNASDPYDPRNRHYIVPATKEQIEKLNIALLKRQMFHLEAAVVRRGSGTANHITEHYRHVHQDLKRSLEVALGHRHHTGHDIRSSNRPVGVCSPQVTLRIVQGAQLVYGRPTTGHKNVPDVVRSPEVSRLVDSIRSLHVRVDTMRKASYSACSKPVFSPCQLTRHLRSSSLSGPRIAQLSPGVTIVCSSLSSSLCTAQVSLGGKIAFPNTMLGLRNAQVCGEPGMPDRIHLIRQSWPREAR